MLKIWNLSYDSNQEQGKVECQRFFTRHDFDVVAWRPKWLQAERGCSLYRLIFSTRVVLLR